MYIGRRVKLNSEYFKLFTQTRLNGSRAGTVTGEGRSGRHVYVTWDGNKAHQCYALKFLDLIPKENEAKLDSIPNNDVL